MTAEVLEVPSAAPAPPPGAPRRPDHPVRWALAGLFVAGLAVAAFANFLAFDRPGVMHPDGWNGFHDQGEYLKMARTMADWKLPTLESGYQYGIGYPILAVPQLWLGFTGDPFSGANTVAFATALVLIALIGMRLRSLTFGIAAALATGVATPMLDTMTTPWNSTVTVVALLGVLLLLARPARSTAVGVLLGGAVGAAFAARYVDAAPIAGVAAVILLWRRPIPVRTIVAASVAALAVGGVVLATHQHAFGDPLTTPYRYHYRTDGGNDQQLSAYQPSRIPRHAVELFLTADDKGKREPRQPLLREAPWLALAPVGLFLLGRRRHPLFRLFLVASVLSAASTMLYLSFGAGGGGALKYGNLRYYVTWFPVWGLLSAYAIAVGFEALSKRAPDGAEAVAVP